jgi:hypothetical protein
MTANFNYQQNLVGLQFGRLTVVSLEQGSRSKSLWLCNCLCGQSKVVKATALLRGTRTSCGCLQKEVVSQMYSTHRCSKLPEYKIWKKMKGRVLNPNDKSYGNYGGRGIKMCQEWQDSFEAFYNDMGPRPSAAHSVERENNDGDYSPSNCKWALIAVQARNRRSTRKYTYKGLTLCITDWAKKIGVPVGTLHSRLRTRDISSAINFVWGEV